MYALISRFIALFVLMHLSVVSHADHHAPEAIDGKLPKYITFSFWDQATPPFVVIDNDALVGGIIKDIGDAMAKEIGAESKFVKLPVARVEPFLRLGKIDADCVTSPIWKETPNEYVWSKPLFDGADRFLIRSDGKTKIDSFDDLAGLRVGVYKGYVYHPVIMEMMEKNMFSAMKVKDLEKGIMLLQLGRIDTLIDFGVLIRYQLMQKKLQDEFTLAKAFADEFKLSCAYSPKSRIHPERMNQAIDTLVDSGKITEILNKYQ